MRFKILAFITVITFLFQFIVVADTYASTVGDLHSMRILTQLGIYKPLTDQNVQTTDTVKRRDLAVIMSNIIMGGNPVYTKSRDLFHDVSSDDPDAKSISIAVQNEILNGNPEGLFLPDMAVSYNEAVKSVVCLLGYKLRAEGNGGYPVGYLSTATSIGLLDKIKVLSGDFITLEDFSQLMYNALDIPIFSQTSFGTGDTVYSSNKDKTILSELFGIYKDKGVIQANDQTALDSPDGMTKGKIKINNTIFEQGNTDAAQYLGYQVTYYYKKETTNIANQLVCIDMDDSKKNDLFKVDVKDVTTLTLLDGSRKMELKYDDTEKGKTDSVEIGSDAYVIYNGKAWLSYRTEDLIPQMGSITLVDNNCDGTYDVMFIDAYETILVNQVSPVFGWVTDQYKKDANGDAYKIDLSGSNSEYDLVVLKDGKQILISDIKIWDVLSVYSSQNSGKQLKKVIVTRNSIDGVASEVSEDDITVNGAKYILSDAFKTYLKDIKIEIPMNTSVTFYFDHNNRIAAMKEISFLGTYGYVRVASKQSGVSGVVEMRVWDIANDKWQTLKCAKKVTLDSKPYSNEDLASMKRKLIRYNVNKDGEITEIFTPDSLYQVPTGLKFNPYIGALCEDNGNGMLYYPGMNTKSISIPADAKDYATEKFYTIGIPFNEANSVSVLMYDVKKYVPGAIIYETSNTSDGVGIGSASIIVTKIASVVDSDGSATAKIYGNCEGANINITLRPEVIESSDFKKIGIGDIVRINTNTQGNGTALAIDYSVKADSLLLAGGGEAYSSTFTDLHMISGTVQMVDMQGGIMVIKGVSGTLYPRHIPSGIVINHNDGARFENAGAGDIEVGRHVVYRSRVRIGRTLEIFVQGE